jgi:hypothetical protein
VATSTFLNDLQHLDPDQLEHFLEQADSCTIEIAEGEILPAQPIRNDARQMRPDHIPTPPDSMPATE